MQESAQGGGTKGEQVPQRSRRTRSETPQVSDGGKMDDVLPRCHVEHRGSANASVRNYPQPQGAGLVLLHDRVKSSWPDIWIWSILTRSAWVRAHARPKALGGAPPHSFGARATAGGRVSAGTSAAKPRSSSQQTRCLQRRR